MDSTIWLSTFKQRPILGTFTGVIVPSVCDGANIDARRKAFVDLYKKYKITVATEPVNIAFHDIVLKGYFDTLSMSNDQQIPKALGFSISFYGIPITLMNDDELTPSKSPDGTGTALSDREGYPWTLYNNALDVVLGGSPYESFLVSTDTFLNDERIGTQF